MTKTEVAYLAGFFDGEGCITLNRGGNRYRVVVDLAQRDPRPLEQIQAWNGAFTLYKRPNGLCHLRLARAREVLKFLHLVLSHLIVKKEQAQLAITYLENFPESVKTQDKLHRSLQSLKARRHLPNRFHKRHDSSYIPKGQRSKETEDDE